MIDRLTSAVRPYVRRAAKLAIRLLLRRVGRSRLAGPIVTTAIWLFQAGLLPRDMALRLCASISRAAGNLVVRVPITLAGRRLSLYLNLKFWYSQLLVFVPLEDHPEAAELRLFSALASRSAHIFDVGANVGLYTYLAAVLAPDARIHAFEPYPEMAQLLRRNVEANGWSDRVQVHEKVIGDHRRRASFYVVDSDSEGTLQADRLEDKTVIQALDVEMISLDDFCRELEIPLSTSLFKIDVEGAEELVLAGFEETLRRSNGLETGPEILIELLENAREAGSVDRLISCGYHAYFVGEKDLLPIRSGRDTPESSPSGNWNFYFTRKDDLDLGR